MTAAPDRLAQLRNQTKVTGLDFVGVSLDQVTLDVHFLRDPKTLNNPLVHLGAANNAFISTIDKDNISIYQGTRRKRKQDIKVESLDWKNENGAFILQLKVHEPGGFVLYYLSIDDDRIDPYFNDIPFSFKAHCPSDLDCAPPGHECPAEAVVDFPVDYRARDFWSFRRALLDFAAQRYPDWQDRLEADAGVMLVEVMSALADEMAYYQDRVAREAYLETATQRRSLHHHARLVDYTVHEGRGAHTWLDVTVEPGAGSLPAGADVWAVSDDGKRIDFEVGHGLHDVFPTKQTFAVNKLRNRFDPHIWDEDDVCLSVGTTEVYVKGHQEQALLPLDKPLEKSGKPGRWVLLKTEPKTPNVSARRWMVWLVEVEDAADPVSGEDITRLEWEEAQALPFEMDLAQNFEVHCNLVPVTAGRTEIKRFAIGPSNDESDHPSALERIGPNGSTAYLFSLPESDERGLVWLGEDPRQGQPEIHLAEVKWKGAAVGWQEEQLWEWRPSLLGVSSSLATNPHFTLEPGTWRRVVGFQRSGKEFSHQDYAGDKGFTIRFGDGECGLVPRQPAIFQVTYRLGNGQIGNVAPDSITHIDKSFSSVKTVTNPLAATDGLDPESVEEIRMLAPEEFRAITYRAVRPEDYAEAAERLAWVQRAGADFRWTGSWLTAFVTPDPRGVTEINAEQREELVNQLERFRQAGRETHVLDPVYADLDLRIHICVEPMAFRGEVKEQVLVVLLGKKGVRARPGFFTPDNFTFGTPLRRSALEAAIQSVPGVCAVEGMCIRRRGWFDWRCFDELIFQVAPNEVVRLENDPMHPGRGSLNLIMEGGA